MKFAPVPGHDYDGIVIRLYGARQPFAQRRLKMETRPLTKKQALVLRFIINEVESSSGPPTIREVGRYFSMSSTGAVRDVLKALRKKGYLAHASKKSRAYRLNPEVFTVSVAGRNRIKMIKEAK